jgi:hypothetical protein
MTNIRQIRHVLAPRPQRRSRALCSTGVSPVFLLYGALNALFIVFFLMLVPETKGVSLEKIEANLLAGLPLRQIGQPPHRHGPVSLPGRSVSAH